VLRARFATASAQSRIAVTAASSETVLSSLEKSRVPRALDEQRESCNIVGSVLDAARPRKGLRPPSLIICVKRTSFSLMCGRQATVI